MKDENLLKSTKDWLKIKITNFYVDSKIQSSILHNTQNELIGIFKIIPIKFNLKSDLEKQGILNNYKKFFTSINKNFQILIINKRLNLNKQKDLIFSKNTNIEKKNLYFKNIDELSKKQKFSTKEYYIVFKEPSADINVQISNMENTYRKAQDLLHRCGNEIETLKEQEMESVLEYFFRSSL